MATVVEPVLQLGLGLCEQSSGFQNSSKKPLAIMNTGEIYIRWAYPEQAHGRCGSNVAGCVSVYCQLPRGQDLFFCDVSNSKTTTLDTYSYLRLL
ncbi:hypothetical protein V1264_012378 [Littorina saxatilis]|uniref:Uncharacterized protein n=1 Tax=Littorina saxatilis TaxID=31220 RepID=A0AAN9GM58_9CAEN